MNPSMRALLHFFFFLPLFLEGRGEGIRDRAHRQSPPLKRPCVYPRTAHIRVNEEVGKNASRWGEGRLRFAPQSKAQDRLPPTPPHHFLLFARGKKGRKRVHICVCVCLASTDADAHLHPRCSLSTIENSNTTLGPASTRFVVTSAFHVSFIRGVAALFTNASALNGEGTVRAPAPLLGRLRPRAARRL